MKSVKKYQVGGAQTGSKKTYTRRGSSKPNSRGEAVDKFKKIVAEKEKPPFQFNPKDSKKIMQSGGATRGATNVGKSTTTKKGSLAATAKKPLTPKAAYGMAVKRGIMKKGGTTKK